MATSDKPKVQFKATNIAKAAPKSLKFLDYLRLSVAGGKPTYDFFAGDYGALNQLAHKMAKEGPSAWTNVDKGSSLDYDFLNPDLPASYVKGTNGTLVMQFHPSDEVMGKDTPDYKEAGIATTYLVTDQGTVDVIVSYIEKLGPAVAGAALLPAITTILGAFKTFFQSFISKAFNAAAEGATEAGEVAGEAAEAAGEEAAVEGEIIADELALSISFGPLAIVGIVVAAIIIVVSVILFFLSKTMTCYVKVFNFTDQQITLNLCHKYDLEVKLEPKTGVLPPMGVPKAPPGVTALSEVIYRADYTFLNSNDLKGLGAVIQAPGEATAANPGGFPGLTAMIDIPSVGDNSLYINLDGSMDCDSVYNNFSGTFKKLAKSTCHGEYRIYMATNQISGKSDNPINGSHGWFYEYLIVIEKDGFFLKSPAS